MRRLETMATDDCHVMTEKPCPCGKSTVVVESCMPDHPWARASQRFLRSTLNCSTCSEVFQIEDRSGFDLGPVVIVERAAVQAREQLLTKWHETRKQVAASPKGKALIQKFIDLLEAQPSMAAMHRILSANGLHVSSIATFRQEVKGPGGIAGLVKRPSEFPNMMAALGISDSELEEDVQELSELWDAAHVELPVVGTPIVGVIKR
jgi:hypothetical protein